MKKTVLFFIFCLFWGAAFALELKIAPPQAHLCVGEKLEYDVEWLGLPVGSITLKLEEKVPWRGAECYRITARALPNSFFKGIYDIEYNVPSFLDTRTLSSLRFEKTRRIGADSNQVIIDFDQKNRSVSFKSEGTQSGFKISPSRPQLEERQPPTALIPAGTQDLLSSFYVFRLLGLEEGGTYPLNIYYNQRNWPVEMKVGKPFIKEMRRRGTFQVVKIYPESEINEYILGGRKFEVYITADSARVPVEFRLNTAIGSLSARIKELPQ
jgi:hypothetical protein